MRDRQQSIPPSFVFAESLSAAHQIRSIAVRLLAVAVLLPLPPQEEADRLMEDATEQTFRDHPALGLYVDLDSLVRDELLPAADALEEAASHGN